jgi:hypothetical protein
LKQLASELPFYCHAIHDRALNGVIKPALLSLLGILSMVPLRGQPTLSWTHITSKNGDIEVPNQGKEQTSAVVADFDNDGINDFAISERTMAPAMVWYRRGEKGWTRYVVEAGMLPIEAGTTACDVDGDGDKDIIAGGDWRSNEVWWWENPDPDFDASKPWNRYLIRNTGNNKQHDQITGDFDGDGRTDVVFWAQGDNTLFFTRIPDKPKLKESWNCIPVYTYYTDGQMEQRGKYPPFKGTNEHEGLAAADIDGDGVQDIIGGGMWFKYLGNDRFAFNSIDGAYSFSRCAAGQFVKGGRPEVILVVGDGWAPLNLYEYRPAGNNNTWVLKTILPEVSNGHSLSVADFNGDGNLDIWNAEMTLFDNTHARNRILLGDGNGNFTQEILVSEGIDLHESEMEDLDGDGDLDILGKPYNGDSPRLDIWLQNGTGKIIGNIK